MAMRKYGAPATSHVRHITAEDAELLNAELSKTEEKHDSEVTPKEDKKSDD